jgi:hypothetical protein
MLYSGIGYSIIGPGFVGKLIASQLQVNNSYNRTNLDSLPNLSHDTIILAAPTGNRIVVNLDPQRDRDDCAGIVDTLKRTQFNRIVYISTVDVFLESSYGQNRLWLEQQIQQFPNHTILRLPSLCDPSIKKNVLFDLANRQWLDKVSLDSTIQWYPTNRLTQDITYVINNNIAELNLVSAPVCNRDIVSKFAPDLLERLGRNTVTPVYYDIKSLDGQYWIDDECMWSELEKSFIQLIGDR